MDPIQSLSNHQHRNNQEQILGDSFWQKRNCKIRPCDEDKKHRNPDADEFVPLAKSIPDQCMELMHDKKRNPKHHDINSKDSLLDVVEMEKPDEYAEEDDDAAG